MMTRKIIITMLIFGTISCSRREGEQKTGLLSHLVSITDNEDKGIKEILDFFGGECKYSIGRVESTNDKEDKKYFEIELMKSVALSKYADKPEFTTSNIAFRFFKNLNQEERQNYTHVRGTLVLGNGERIEHDYSREDLTLVEKKLKIVMNVLEVIREKRFEDIEPILNPEDVFTYDKNQLIDGLRKFDPQFGNIQEFRLFGFKFTNAGDNEVLNISGMLVRDIQSNEFKVYLNPHSEKEEILSLDYKW
jgi:hypothetical protein